MTETKKNEQEVVVNLDTLGIPVAIIIAGVIIASVIFFTSKDNGSTDTKSGTDDTVAADDVPAPSGEDVTVTIGDDPYIGNRDKAKVAIVEFSDFQCGYCARHATETFPSIKSNFVDKDKIIYVFKEFPLSSEGQLGFNTAEAGVCVNSLAGMDIFADFHKQAFSKQSDAEVKAIATSLGVDGGKFDACLSGNQFVAEINADKTEGMNVGITGTPGFVVGLIGEDGKVTGKLIAGAYPYSTFEQELNDLLK